MSDALETQGTTLEIETGSGSAANITAITLGAITKITATAHGFSEGDVVDLASIGGTTELNGETALIIGAETDDFYVDIDSSGYTAYTSGGTATPQTYTEIAEVVDFDGPGGSASVIDASHLKSTAREKRMGLPDEGQFSLSVNWIPTDTGQSAVRTARSNRSLKGFRITYTDAAGTIQTFNGYVLQFSSSGSVDAKVDGSITIEISGAVSTT